MTRGIRRQRNEECRYKLSLGESGGVACPLVHGNIRSEAKEIQHVIVRSTSRWQCEYYGGTSYDKHVVDDNIII